MSLDELNWCPQATVVLHDGTELSDEEMSERKAIYLEGLVRFLNIYAQTEIGEGFELDITKIGLFINSARFENDDLYAIRSVNDVFQLCEALVLHGLPIWRFLRLNSWHEQLLEQSYCRLLSLAREQAATVSPCYDCVWYKEVDTFLGVLKRCTKPFRSGNFERQSSYDPSVVKECEWQTTLDTLPKAVDELSQFDKMQFESRLTDARKRFKRELSADPFRLARVLSEEEYVDLTVQYDSWVDFARIFGNKRAKSEMQYEVRKAMCVEGMIRFFEMYAKCEVGSDYIANIRNIALWAGDYDKKSEINSITSYEDMYAILEKMILEDSISVMDFVCRDKDDLWY